MEREAVWINCMVIDYWFDIIISYICIIGYKVCLIEVVVVVVVVVVSSCCSCSSNNSDSDSSRLLLSKKDNRSFVSIDNDNIVISL